MKKLFSKNTIIALLLLTIATMGAYILAKETNFRAIGGMTAPPSHTPRPALKAEVKGASLKASEFQACYQEYLARAPSASDGSIVVNWMTDAQGHLDFLKLMRSDFDDEPFAQCVLEKVQNTRFPASAARAGIIISHKFNFHRKDSARADF